METYTDADEFTSSSRDPITLISAVTAINGKIQVYLLSRLKINKPKSDAKILQYKSEKDLIEGFFKLWRDFSPDKSITYNGFNYDIPYLIARAGILGADIGRLGKIKGLDAWSCRPVDYNWSRS